MHTLLPFVLVGIAACGSEDDTDVDVGTDGTEADTDDVGTEADTDVGTDTDAFSPRGELYSNDFEDVTLGESLLLGDAWSADSGFLDVAGGERHAPTGRQAVVFDQSGLGGRGVLVLTTDVVADPNTDYEVSLLMAGFPVGPNQFADCTVAPRWEGGSWETPVAQAGLDTTTVATPIAGADASDGAQLQLVFNCTLDGNGAVMIDNIVVDGVEPSE